MACQRCLGFCVNEELEGDGHRIIALKCINCGSVVDPTIIKNRQTLKNKDTLENIEGGSGRPCEAIMKISILYKSDNAYQGSSE